jgi:hypothetical protein
MNKPSLARTTCLLVLVAGGVRLRETGTGPGRGPDGPCSGGGVL